MTKQVTKRLSDFDFDLLKRIAEHDAPFGEKPNDSMALRRLIRDEARRLGFLATDISPTSVLPKQSDTPIPQAKPPRAKRAKSSAAPTRPN